MRRDADGPARSGGGPMLSRKNVITIIVLASLIAGVILFYEYGWQHTGFKMVTHPNLLLIDRVEETDGRIVIQGKTALNIGTYAGSVLDFQEGVLYVGVRYSLFGNDLDFLIDYPQAEGTVHRVVLKKNEIEKTIWIRPWKEQAWQ